MIKPSFYNQINSSFIKSLDQKITLLDFYDVLCHSWNKQTCAPRLRDIWDEDNNLTVGQCSISAFLVQDLFGGEVLGIPLDNGGVHCFNKINNQIFDLTSDQFKEKQLDYSKYLVQLREIHFQDKDKYLRYNELKEYVFKILNF